MPKKKQIEAKPTIYRNVRYRSRLEARWAVLFDNCNNVLHFVYEPITVVNRNTGWEYTPDFLVTYLIPDLPPSKIYVEVKPQPPTEEYIKALKQHTVTLIHPLMLVFGPIYKDEPICSTVFVKDKSGQPIHPETLFTGYERAYDIASSYRFDI